MGFAMMLLGVTLFPVAGLGLLLWLAYLEDTLPRDVRAAKRRPPPAPVLAIPVRRPLEPTQQVLVPAQRTAPAAGLVDQAAPLAVTG